MEEENKEVVVEEQPKQEVVEAEQPKAEAQPQQSGMNEACKYVLISFILALVGLTVSPMYLLGGLACAVLGIIVLIRSKNFAADKQPFRTFEKIAKPVAIVDIILGALSALGWFIYTVVLIISSILRAINN